MLIYFIDFNIDKMKKNYSLYYVSLFSYWEVVKPIDLPMKLNGTE